MRGAARAVAWRLAALAATPAVAAPINNPVAEFTGLDKITGRTITFDVLVDETVQFGALQVTPRVCHTRPPTEPAQTTAFVEVDEITLSNKIQRLFTGWMFAASPGLHAVEHPVYDVWLVDCKMQMGAGAGSAAAARAAAEPGRRSCRAPDARAGGLGAATARSVSTCDRQSPARAASAPLPENVRAKSAAVHAPRRAARA